MSQLVGLVISKLTEPMGAAMRGAQWQEARDEDDYGPAREQGWYLGPDVRIGTRCALIDRQLVLAGSVHPLTELGEAVRERLVDAPKSVATSAYREALRRGRRVGAGRCDDAAAMALFCEANIQLLLGAVGPQLIWEGAQKQGLTFLQLGKLCSTDPAQVEALQWL